MKNILYMILIKLGRIELINKQRNWSTKQLNILLNYYMKNSVGCIKIL